MSLLARTSSLTTLNICCKRANYESINFVDLSNLLWLTYKSKLKYESLQELAYGLTLCIHFMKFAQWHVKLYLMEGFSSHVYLKPWMYGTKWKHADPSVEMLNHIPVCARIGHQTVLLHNQTWPICTYQTVILYFVRTITPFGPLD
jgi:hypothetical protein